MLFLLEDDLVVAVTIEVADGCIVGRVAFGCLQRDRNVRQRRSVRGEGERLARGSFATVDDRANGIRSRPIQTWRPIQEPSGAAQRLVVELHRDRFLLAAVLRGLARSGGPRRTACRRAVDVEGDAVEVAGEQAPADE